MSSRISLVTCLLGVDRPSFGEGFNMKQDMSGMTKGVIWGITVLVIIGAGPSIMMLMLQVIYYGDSSWTDAREEQGPLPLSSPNAPITRLVNTKTTIEVTLKEVLWDEGNGPIPPKERVKRVVNAVPRDLTDRLRSTRDYQARATLVSVKPDVLIVTVREWAKASKDHPFENWYETGKRGHYLRQRIEYIGPAIPDSELSYVLTIYAGSLVPWSNEMYVVSTDRKIQFGRLKFENDQATVLLPVGKLVLHHHDDEVDVSRE